MNEELVKYIFLFLLGTSVLNFAIAVTARIKTQHKEFNDLIAYWAAVLVTFISAVKLSHSSTEIAFAFFFHIFSNKKPAERLVPDLPTRVCPRYSGTPEKSVLANRSFNNFFISRKSN